MKRLFSTVVLAGAAMSQLGSTDCGQALRDPGFDLWCGKDLCAWKLERGSVTSVPTWNEGDPGVLFDGDDVAIEQLSPVSSSDGECIEFDLLADIDDLANVQLNVDVFGDGSVEYSSPVPTSHWEPFSYRVEILTRYHGVRFELVKTGTGRAVLANIGAKIATDCPGGVETISPAPAPDGAECDSNAGCRSGLCGAGTLFANECVGCNGATPCASGDVCGLGDPTSPVFGIPLECVAQNARQLGENCFTDLECASGTCNSGMCSTCKADTDCTSGQTCAQADWPLALGYAKPWECSPGLQLRASGEPCASDDDCASEHCVGSPRMQCDDGRSCATAADCPFGGPDTQNGLQNGPCDTVGVQGGTCQ